MSELQETKELRKENPCCTNVKDTLRKIDSGPSSDGGPGDRKHKQIPVDLVEEESMESFPASDPPGHLRSNTNRPEPRRPGQEVD